MDNRFTIKLPVVPEEALLRLGEGPPYLVESNAPAAIQRAMVQLARYFQREFSYDFVNYDGSPGCEAWLWVDREFGSTFGRFLASGHAVFWRGDHGWELGSVWQHPYRRGHGRLTGVWPQWQSRYGEFHIAQPWSPAMEGFLAGQGVPPCID